MKRISCRITAIYEALFMDFKMWGYGSPKETERDLSRIVSLVETRGIRTVLLDLPAYAKLFDYAISRGSKPKGLFPLLGKEVGGYPLFMASSFERVFDRNGILLADADPGAVLNLRQVLRAFQKVEIPCQEAYVKETVNAFFRTDRSLRPVSPAWYSGDFSVTANFADAITDPSQGYLKLGDSWDTSHSLVSHLTMVCDLVVASFPALDPDSIIGKHGPGAVADASGSSDKYEFPTWPARLAKVFPRDLHASANLRLHDYEADPLDQHEVPAKLIAVPKNQEKPRLIASEPTGNQFIQGGIRKYLLTCIDGTSLCNSISIESQEKSRERALEASKDSQWSTVDLKDASDRLSCWTVERALRRRPDLLAALAASRSAALRDPKYSQNTILLRKYAPQGNATVFPLQSCIYSMMAIAAVLWSLPAGEWRRLKRTSLHEQIDYCSRRVTVFGDDIILPTYALPALSSLLELCQLKVNGAKSHYSGNFAESCGMDAFRGVDVTPAYVKHIEDTESPEAVSSTAEVCNNFYRRGLYHTSRVVETWIPKDYLRTIPISSTPDGLPIALQSFSSGTAASRTRYNSNLYREEILVLALRTSSKSKRRDKWESLLQWYTENPSQDNKSWKSGVQQEVRQKLCRKWVSLPG